MTVKLYHINIATDSNLRPLIKIKEIPVALSRCWITKKNKNKKKNREVVTRSIIVV